MMEKKGEMDRCISETAQWKIETWHLSVLPMENKCDFFLMMSSVPLLRHHIWIHKTRHAMSMKISDGHQGINWSTEKIDDAIGHVVKQLFFWKKKNLHKSTLKWLNRLRKNFTGITAYRWGIKSSPPMTSYITWFGSHIGLTVKPLKSFFSRTSG